MCFLPYFCSLPPWVPVHVLIQNTSKEQASHWQSPFGDVMQAVLAAESASLLLVRKSNSISNTLWECLRGSPSWMQGEIRSPLLTISTSFLTIPSGPLRVPDEKNGCQRFIVQSQSKGCMPFTAQRRQEITRRSHPWPLISLQQTKFKGWALLSISEKL